MVLVFQDAVKETLPGRLTLQPVGPSAKWKCRTPYSKINILRWRRQSTNPCSSSRSHKILLFCLQVPLYWASLSFLTLKLTNMPRHYLIMTRFHLPFLLWTLYHPELQKHTKMISGFPGGSVVKTLPGQCRRQVFNPWSGKIPHTSEQLSPWATTTEAVL